jgi:hypothetical protein
MFFEIVTGDLGSQLERCYAPQGFFLLVLAAQLRNASSSLTVLPTTESFASIN